MNAQLVPVVIGLLAGILLGGGYFVLLHQTVQRFGAAGAAGRILGLTALRALLAIGTFWGLAQLGGWSLLAGLAGFLLARRIVRRRLEH